MMKTSYQLKKEPTTIVYLAERQERDAEGHARVCEIERVLALYM